MCSQLARCRCLALGARVLLLLSVLTGAGPAASTAQAPLALGGDPRVDPQHFQITTYATGLNFPVGMASLDDGSIVVATTNGDRFFGSSSGRLIRLTDDDGDGISDQRDVLVDSVPGGRLTSLVRAGDLLIVTGSGSPITIYRIGDDAMTISEVGRLTLQYPGPWQHNHTTLAVRRIVDDNHFELFFQVGSAENFAASADSVVLDSDIGAAGLLAGDAIHRIEMIDDGSAVTGEYIGQVAGGLRNASGLAFHPESGDLYIAENGIDGLANASEAFSADELNLLPEHDVGGPVEHFGFPESYEEYRTGVMVGGAGIAPLLAYQPIPDPNTGDESEGPNQMVFSPEQFPAYLNSGLFTGFHGQFADAGPDNGENPLVFTDPEDLGYFHIIGVDEPGVGHLNGLLARESELFLADMSSDGGLGTDGFETGVIYRIFHPPSAPDVSMDPSLSDSTIFQTELIELSASAFDVQDGALDDQIVWTSSLDGQIGTGPSISFAPDVVGSRTITASVTDSRGAESSAGIELTVRRAPVHFTDCPLRRDGPEDATLVIPSMNAPTVAGMPAEVGTEIAVFEAGSDECSGVGIVERDEIRFPIDGDDGATEPQDGVAEGAFIEFSVWTPTSGRVFRGQDITVEWMTGPDYQSSGLFVPGATYVVDSMQVEEVVLSAPELISPADEATDVTLQSEFVWSSVEQADRYRLQLSTEPTFLESERDTLLQTTTLIMVDPPLAPGTDYLWRVAAVAGTEQGDWSTIRSFRTASNTGADDPDANTRSDVSTPLSVFPNPVRDRLMFEFGSAETDVVRLTVLDVSGREIALLVDGVLPIGVHRIRWTPKALANGVYVVHLRSGSRIHTRPFVVMR